MAIMDLEPDDTCLDEEDLPSETLLITVCGELAIDSESNVVRLVHYTTQEYFLEQGGEIFPHAQLSISQACIRYLSMDSLGRGPCTTNTDMETRLEKYKLLDYASRNWGNHTRGDPEEKIKELALKFLEHTSKLMCYNQVIHLPEYQYRYAEYSQRFPKHVTGLHVVASIGLAKIAQLLLEREGVDANSKDEDGRTPLLWAADNGHEAVVQLLLEHEGVDANSKDEDGRTPLLWAAANGHEAVVQLLLEHEGVDADSKDEYRRTPLLWAADNGHEAVVRLLKSHHS